MVRMKRKRYEALDGYLSDLVEKMRLCHWRIFLNRTTAQDNTFFAVITIGGYGPEATLTISDVFFTLPAAGQRQVLVHELCHLVLVRLDHVVFDLSGWAEGAPPPQAYKRQVEFVVDHFAWMLVDQLPMPPDLA